MTLDITYDGNETGSDMVVWWGTDDLDGIAQVQFHLRAGRFLRWSITFGIYVSFIQM